MLYNLYNTWEYALSCHRATNIFCIINNLKGLQATYNELWPEPQLSGSGPVFWSILEVRMIVKSIKVVTITAHNLPFKMVACETLNPRNA